MCDFCGIPLTAFGLVIGWLNVIVAVFNTTLLCMALADFEDVVAAMRALYNVSAADGVWFKYFVFFGLCVALALSVLIGIASALLIVGIYRRRHHYMTLFLILMAIIIVLLFCAFSFCLAGSCSIGVVFLHIWMLILTCLISCPICLLYKEIRKENLNGLTV